MSASMTLNNSLWWLLYLFRMLGSLSPEACLSYLSLEYSRTSVAPGLSLSLLWCFFVFLSGNTGYVGTVSSLLRALGSHCISTSFFCVWLFWAVCSSFQPKAKAGVHSEVQVKRTCATYPKDVSLVPGKTGSPPQGCASSACEDV